ncbi:unnamed protein product [Mytilus coruscus]|uniref:Uncharacterized protein n=1 Tax=Mytilus coruscus TaxID=42192 RepID=A0A6J8BYX6_MYTCO|nr:unnamed protein product [Mytilus coruscus]
MIKERQDIVSWDIHLRKERWAKFENHVSSEVEEKLWLVDGIRDDGNIPYIIGMTEDDNDDSDINGDLDDEDGSDMEIDSDLNITSLVVLTTMVSPNFATFVRAATPPKQKRETKRSNGSSVCTVRVWLHEKCRKGAARKGDMFSRSHSILRHKDLKMQLLLKPMDKET